MSRIIRGSAAQGLQSVLELILSFILMPIMLKSLGSEKYGLWIVAFAFIPYLTFLSNGLANAVQRFTAQAVGRGDTQDMSTVASCSLIMFSAAGGISILIAVLIAYFGRGLVSPEQAQLFSILVVMMGFQVGLSLPAVTFMGMLVANMRHDVQAGVEISTSIIRTLIVLVMLSTAPDLLSLGIIYLVCHIVSKVVIVWAAFRFVPDLKIDFSLLNKTTFLKLFDFGAFASIAWLGELLRNSSHSFVVSKVAGTASVVFISIPFMLINYSNMMVHTTLNVFVPLLTQHHANDNQAMFRQSLTVVMDLALWLGTLIGLGLLLVGADFIHLWINEESFEKSEDVIFIFAFYLFFISTQLPLHYLFSVFNIQRILARVMLFEGIAVLVCEYFLLKRYGLSGVALGLVIPVFISRVCIMSLIIYPRLGEHKEVLRNHMIRLVTLLCAALLLSYFEPLQEIIAINSWLSLGAWMICIPFIYTIVFFLLVASKVTKAELYERAKGYLSMSNAGQS